MLSVERLKEVLTYDPKTGQFIRNKSEGGWKAKGVAGCVKPDGYRWIAIDRTQYAASRLVWFYHHGAWPDGDIDHKNHQRDDNRLENLRLCSRSENLANQRLGSRNKSGFKGVSKVKQSGKWYASIKVMGKSMNLGHYERPEDAHAAYCEAAKKHFGKFAKTS